MAVYTVPDNYTFYMDDITFTSANRSGGTNREIVVSAKIREFETNTFNTKFKNVLRAGTTSYDFKYPLKIEEKSDIKLTAESINATGDPSEVSGTFQGLLVKNS